jgi:hypothetical protein
LAALSRNLRAALELARLGFPVFPLYPRTKKPMTAHGLLDATTDPEAIRDWFELCPTANVGLAVPQGFVVVDIDDPEALLRLKAEDRHLPATAKCRSPRGWHCYYRTEVELRNAVDLVPGVDLRGVGGYVLVPPSVHPSGGRYEWEVPLLPENIADAPDWLVEAARRRGASRVRPVEEWRAIAAQGVDEGARNETVASLAGHLLRREVDPFVTLNLLLCWNATRCRPPLSEEEVARVVNSIAGRERRRRERCG